MAKLWRPFLVRVGVCNVFCRMNFHFMYRTTDIPIWISTYSNAKVYGVRSAHYHACMQFTMKTCMLRLVILYACCNKNKNTNAFKWVWWVLLAKSRLTIPQCASNKCLLSSDISYKCVCAVKMRRIQQICFTLRFVFRFTGRCY